MQLVFLETPTFTRRIQEALDLEDYLALQTALLLRPEQGQIIKGSGGLRKVRWSAGGTGKRGGLRVIYYWDPGRSVCYMLYAYGKNEQGDLTPRQVRALAQLVRDEFQ